MELGWLLDDAINSSRGFDGRTPNSRKMQKLLALDSRTAEDCSVRMRIDMGSLDRLWQQRTRERCNSAPKSGSQCCSMHSVTWLNFTPAIGSASPGQAMPCCETYHVMSTAVDHMQACMQGALAIPYRVCTLAGPYSCSGSWSAHTATRDRASD